jgi:type II secretion system protein G
MGLPLESFAAFFFRPSSKEGRVLHAMNRFWFRAFTLLELLVVIAVLGLLMAMLLPAILATQERARQTQCLSRLKQLAMGLAMYEQENGMFPTGCLGCKLAPRQPGRPSVPQRFISWNLSLLPYIEQRGLFEGFNIDLASFHAANMTAASTPVEMFLCPSTTPDVRVNLQGRWKGLAFTDFAGVYGVEGVGRTTTDPRSPHFLKDEFLGVMLYETPVPRRDIIDGSSYTVCLSEMSPRRTIECEWANGENLFAQTGENPINGSVGLGTEMGSAHPGGVQVAFADGHAEFLAASMDQRLLNSLLTKAGKELARP